jgi:hypothetical protein
MPVRMAPCLLGWTCSFCIVRGWSRHDLAMTWERHTSVLHVFCKVFGDLRSKLDVHMHVSYADFYVFLHMDTRINSATRKARSVTFTCPKQPGTLCIYSAGEVAGDPPAVIQQNHPKHYVYIYT